MNKIRIGVVENEMVIADSINLTLQKLGYDILPAAYNYAAAIAMIDHYNPDLLLLDINLGEDKDGVDVAYYSRNHHQVPIIFLTANSDPSTVDRAKPIKPNAYLVKPFTKEDLYAAIEIAISNHGDTKAHEQESILIKDGYDFVKVDFNEILYLSSEQNYVTFHLRQAKKVMMRSTMQEMEERLSKKRFIRVNRSSMINLRHVSKIETDRVFINGQAFTLTKQVHDLLLEQMHQMLN